MPCGTVSVCVDFLQVANFGCFSLLSLVALFRLLGVSELMQMCLWVLVSGIHGMHF